MKNLTIFPIAIVDIFNKKSNMLFKHIEAFEISPGQYQPTPTGTLQIDLQRRFAKFIARCGSIDATFIKTKKYTACYIGAEVASDSIGGYVCMISLSSDSWQLVRSNQLQELFSKHDSEFNYAPLSPTRFELRFTLNNNFASGPRSDTVVRMLIPNVDGAPLNITQTLKEAALALWGVHTEHMQRQVPVDFERT
jgi:hypothetical protein